MIQRILATMCAAVSLLSVSCSEGGLEPDYSSIADPMARWEAYKYTDYTIEQVLSCFCPYGGIPIKVVVRNRQVFKVYQAGNGFTLPAAYWSQFQSIDGLFDVAESVNPDSVSVFTVEYDARYGFPTVIFVDPSDTIADEEYGFRTGVFERK
ncbi:MAG TPA: DUF6174 domain-containing protein [Bacteroidota bacterium]|nr:DUF6174 domain-containing protein [Bacteroidota bacterium]